MRAKNILSILFIAISLNSCSSDEPQWADPEAHEKTEQLREQYVDQVTVLALASVL